MRTQLPELLTATTVAMQVKITKGRRTKSRIRSVLAVIKLIIGAGFFFLYALLCLTYFIGMDT
mgnify:CR=1 FL=1